ncbi:ligand-binding protein SH3 [Metapseudomonas otitidis]|uniref:ligand-binding protein SH3 n=2 Tax=Metapseudomonas otitidis TaxID=319939 RepID=UPI0013F67DED|nr:ligand-binding protein SH3 [Pseudomonas otitidis]
MTRFIAHTAHRSEFPEPLAFTAGEPLVIGECYDGQEGWEHWYFCTLPGTPSQPGGWVPAQVIEWGDVVDGIQHGRAREDYTARELDVECGDMLQGGRQLNGWVWCEHLPSLRTGWVPLSVLEVLAS